MRGRDNGRMGLLLTEGASEVQGFTGALCIHLLEYISLPRCVIVILC